MSVYLFVENGFMALLRLIYHFCRIPSELKVFREFKVFRVLRDPRAIVHPLRACGSRPPVSGGHCGMWLTNKNSCRFVSIRGKN